MDVVYTRLKYRVKIAHWLGSICPPAGSPPRFLQLFIYDTENEINNRLRFYNREGSSSLNAVIVNRLSTILHRENRYVSLFKTAYEYAQEQNLDDFSVRIYYDPSKNKIIFHNLVFWVRLYLGTRKMRMHMM